MPAILRPSFSEDEIKARFVYGGLQGQLPVQNMRFILSRALLAFTSVLFAAPALAQDTSAVVLMYHRFGEAKYPNTNSTLEQLDAHIAYLQANDFKVLPLPEVDAALKARKPLPPKAVAITIDDETRLVLVRSRVFGGRGQRGCAGPCAV